MVGTGHQCAQKSWLGPAAIQSSESRFFKHSKCSTQYTSFSFFFSVQSSPPCALPSFYPQGYRTRLHGVEGGEVKALCTACQITFLMTSLSGFFMSEKRKKKQGREVRGGESFLFLVMPKSLIHFIKCYLFNLFFQFLHFKFSSSYSKGSNNLAD